jgi:1-acyl-sn-glycerol-3-phosphate acyltransferase
MYSKLSAFILYKLWGWKCTGKYPHEVKKLVLIVAPHTSNWDFPVGVLVRSAEKIDAYFVGKHTIFFWPLGGFIKRFLRGIPVDRRTRGNFVDSTAALFETRDYLHIVIAPEGTRSLVSKFKTGFYYTAKAANVPIALCKFDWEHKEVYFDPQLFYPTDDENADMAYLWNYYVGVKGYNPEKGIHLQ